MMESAEHASIRRSIRVRGAVLNPCRLRNAGSRAMQPPLYHGNCDGHCALTSIQSISQHLHKIQLRQHGDKRHYEAFRKHFASNRHEVSMPFQVWIQLKNNTEISIT
ncbi:hypothetical protein [Paraburkholderia tropica]|uniref:hypothetical protein n=2 Tax=Paraburkholderia tropica TaxID=92647 RepID=UPI002AB09A10|nr:hypothetical protein [Paraburkholderia tropica]